MVESAAYTATRKQQNDVDEHAGAKKHDSACMQARAHIRPCSHLKQAAQWLAIFFAIRHVHMPTHAHADDIDDIAVWHSDICDITQQLTHPGARFSVPETFEPICAKKASDKSAFSCATLPSLAPSALNSAAKFCNRSIQPS